MAVGVDGELTGSIGGGVMEVNLVEQSRKILSVPSNAVASAKDQVHRKGSRDASGMICSGKQTVIFYKLSPADSRTVVAIIESLESETLRTLVLRHDSFVLEPDYFDRDFAFEKISDTEFSFSERLGFKSRLFIVGGGHCALALSELMSRMDFHISIFDDRPDLNTLEKNRFADVKRFIDSYERIKELIPSGDNHYVVVMTLGYKSDASVMQQLIDKNFKYFGVLGSKAKMATLLNELRNDGFPEEKLNKIRTPIGLKINSHTPEEIAVSIAAEIISIKNS